MEANTLLVTITAARGLYVKSRVTLDAYATITLQGKGSLRSRVTTEVIQTEGDCKWDETSEFKLSEKMTTLCVAVHHKTKIGSGDLVGKFEVDLEKAKTLGGFNWFQLKKRKDDEKYRGEVQLSFKFSYEKSTLSVSNMSLNKIEAHKDGMLSKMKRKIKLAKGHKQAEDTMSMASGISGISMKSTKSNKFFDKLTGTFGRNKSSTLPVGTFLTANNSSMVFDTSADASNGMYDTCVSNGASRLAPPNADDVRNRSGSGYLVFDNSSSLSRPASAVGFNQSTSSTNVATARAITPNNRFSLNGGLTSPSVSTAESFHRAESVHSVASSGFESSKLPKLLDASNSQDLLAVIDSLKLELQVKESRIKDMQFYMDNLISRVMERNPELLAAPVAEKPKRRFF